MASACAITADERIELRCGKATIIMEKDGHITIRGTYRDQPRQRRQSHPRRLDESELMPAPILQEIVRQHAETGGVPVDGLRSPSASSRRKPRDGRGAYWALVERLEAHLDGLRVAGEAGRAIAQERYAEYPEVGELFVARMLRPEAKKFVYLT